MQYSTLYKISSHDICSEAEVETRLLAKLFNDLGFDSQHILPKKALASLWVHDGIKKTTKQVDFILLNQKKVPTVIVEAKDPKVDVQSAWGQAASYALSYNKDKKNEAKVKWLLISNGHVTSLFKHDSEIPIITLQLSDFSSGSPPYTILKSHIKYDKVVIPQERAIVFRSIAPDKLNLLFFKCHDLVWKKEKLNPTDAFFEFCKFIFIKIREDKKREKLPLNTAAYKIPLTLKWLESHAASASHPVRDILFSNLHKELETAIRKESKKRIFEPDETLKLSASTCRELINNFEKINLSAIDEDLNGRMFEVFLTAAIRGRALGQYFTPRPVVDFMTRIGLQNTNIVNAPKVIDACSGTAGFLIEVMAYLLSGLREDTRYNEREKKCIKNKICNQQLYGIEANERVARIARINMYLHGDGGSHVFHGDGLDNAPSISSDMSSERKDEVVDHIKKIIPGTFDLVLSNPPFSMRYDASNEDENKILLQRFLGNNKKTAKSSMLFLDRYCELMKAGGEMLIILDDTLLNGRTYKEVRKWMLDKFVILGIHSLPFNAFFKANANVKTSIVHLRKKVNKEDAQGHIFMSISNNIGHDNALRDTYDKNNLNDIFNTYIEWKRTGKINQVFRDNQDKDENLECPEQVWLLPPDKLSIERFDAFFYSLELMQVYKTLKIREEKEELIVRRGRDLKPRKKLSAVDKKNMRESANLYKYIEIGDVTKFGLITSYVEDKFKALPSRGEYQVREGDLLFALNNSSRGTVVKVPKAFDGAIVTSGFFVLIPYDDEEANLLWYSLRSEFCRKQVYYLAQTASQPELKIDTWNDLFVVPIPKGNAKTKALQEASIFFKHMETLLQADRFVFK